MRVFVSKISFGLVIFMFLFLITSSLFTLTNGSTFNQKNGIILGLQLLVFSLIIYSFYSIRYIISGNILYIKISVFYRKDININTITKVSKTYSLLSAPAASLTHRLELRLDNGKKIIVSPKKKLPFLEALKRVNPDIEFNT